MNGSSGAILLQGHFPGYALIRRARAAISGSLWQGSPDKLGVGPGRTAGPWGTDTE
jgi:hypothetical protein